jgi:mRNA-degrading endonuclease RelE of RelBE toxin-antitoxin system
LKLKVKVLPKAKKDLTSIPQNDLKKVLLAIKELENYPNVSNIKKLINFLPAYSEELKTPYS